MSGKKSRSNKKQIEVLVDFMSTHNNLATGEFTGPLGSQSADAQWLRLKDLLKEYGPDRSIEQWKQTWKDLKKNARAENAASAQARNATGNMVDIPVVTATTTKILDTIGHECSTGTGPPESSIGLATVHDTNITNYILVEDPDTNLNKENVPTASSQAQPTRPRASARPAVHDRFASLQHDHNSTLDEIRGLLLERNGLLHEQNSLLAQSNRIARRNR